MHPALSAIFYSGSETSQRPRRTEYSVHQTDGASSQPTRIRAPAHPMKIQLKNISIQLVLSIVYAVPVRRCYVDTGRIPSSGLSRFLSFFNSPAMWSGIHILHKEVSPQSNKIYCKYLRAPDSTDDPRPSIPDPAMCALLHIVGTWFILMCCAWSTVLDVRYDIWVQWGRGISSG